MDFRQVLRKWWYFCSLAIALLICEVLLSLLSNGLLSALPWEHLPRAMPQPAVTEQEGHEPQSSPLSSPARGWGARVGLAV